MGDSPSESSYFPFPSNLFNGDSEHALHEGKAPYQFITSFPSSTHLVNHPLYVTEQEELPVHSGHGHFNVTQGQTPSTDVYTEYYSPLPLTNHPHQCDHAPPGLQQLPTHWQPGHSSLYTPTYDLSATGHDNGPVLPTAECSGVNSYKDFTEVFHYGLTLVGVQDTGPNRVRTMLDERYDPLASNEEVDQSPSQYCPSAFEMFLNDANCLSAKEDCPSSEAIASYQVHARVPPYLSPIWSQGPPHSAMPPPSLVDIPSLAPAPTESYQRPIVQAKPTAEQVNLPFSTYHEAPQEARSSDDSLATSSRSSENARPSRQVTLTSEYRVDVGQSDTESSAHHEFYLCPDGFAGQGGTYCAEPGDIFSSPGRPWEAPLSPNALSDKESRPHDLWPAMLVPDSSPGPNNKDAAQLTLTFINAQALEALLADTPPPELPPLPLSRRHKKRFIRYHPYNSIPSPDASGDQSDEEEGSKRRFVACRECRRRKYRCHDAEPHPRDDELPQGLRCCQRCVKRQIPCMFAAQRSVRGKAAKRSTSDGARSGTLTQKEVDHPRDRNPKRRWAPEAEEWIIPVDASLRFLEASQRNLSLQRACNPRY